MIHVNARALITRTVNESIQILIQLRQRKGEPEVYELPGGRIEEYEKITDALRREVKEETGLTVTYIQNEENKIVTTPSNNEHSFSVECIKPFAAYQTFQGPVDSFGVYFICHGEGDLLDYGDDTAKVHWAHLDEVNKLIDNHKFSDIDLPAILLFMKENVVDEN